MSDIQKVLRLDAQSEGARKVAECLIGSPYMGKYCLRGVTDTEMFMLDDETDDGYFIDFDNIVLLPLDTLKFCPYMAMKNKINVLLSNASMTDWRSILNFYSNGVFGDKGGLYYDFENSEYDTIQLDIYKLPIGCSIV